MKPVHERFEIRITHIVDSDQTACGRPNWGLLILVAPGTFEYHNIKSLGYTYTTTKVIRFEAIRCIEQ